MKHLLLRSLRQMLDFIRARKPATRLVSICTGAMIRAASGVLDEHNATTKREVVAPEVSPFAVMRERYRSIDAREASVVDCGVITTRGGVALCIDTMLHVLEPELGPRVAHETARIIEYSRAREANRRKFPPIVIA